MKKYFISLIIIGILLTSCYPKVESRIEEEIDPIQEKLDKEANIANDFLILVYSADSEDVEEFKKLINSEPTQNDGISSFSYEEKYITYLKEKYKDIPIEEKEWEDMFANRYLNFMTKIALDNDTTYKIKSISLTQEADSIELYYKVKNTYKSYKGSIRIENGVIKDAKIDKKGE